MSEIKLVKRLKAAEDIFKALVDSFGLDIDTASNFLNSIPDTEAEPVRHGRWIDHPADRCSLFNGWNCSECMQIISGGRGKYCPHCGAKMDGGVKE